MREEVRFFARAAVFAAVVTVVYWFASYEPVGTVLLALFALAATGATAFLRAMSGGATRGAAGGVVDRLSDPGPFHDESGRIPSPTAAPFLVGLAAALAGLALVFGPWFLLIAAGPFAIGVGGWIGGARRELGALERDDQG